MAKSRTKNGRTAVVLFALAGGMVGLAFASVPLYQLFCKVTGYGGTVNIEAVASNTVSKELVSVRFDANVNSSLDWQFKPLQTEIKLRAGENKLALFSARNLSDKTIVGTATFNVTPYKAALYFNKIDCFCFTEQVLAPGQETSMPVSFYVDPEMLTDPSTREVRTITLSYTFYPAKDQSAAKTAENGEQNTQTQATQTDVSRRDVTDHDGVGRDG